MIKQYKIFYNSKKIDKAIKKISSATRKNIFRALILLEENPFRKDVDIKKLKGVKNGYRLKVADFRVIYTLDKKNKIIDLENIKHRKEAYKL